MKLVVVFALFVTLAWARPQQFSSSRDAVILKYETENDGSGAYRFAYETSDGQARDEQGVLKNPGTDNEALSVTGSFSFVGQDGVVYQVSYIADENGFRPEGKHIPKLGLPPAAIGSLIGGGLG